MPYSSAQDAKLKDAKAKLDSATSAKDSAYADMSSHYDSYMVNCKYKWSTPAKGELWDAEGCDSGVNASQHVGCGSKQSCQSRVSEINGKVGAYNTALSAYNSAKANYDTVLAEVTVELENDPDAQSQIASATATAQGQAKVTTIKWIIFGTLLVLIVGGYVYFKWIRKVAPVAG